jgi:hypothetical protein
MRCQCRPIYARYSCDALNRHESVAAATRHWSSWCGKIPVGHVCITQEGICQSVPCLCVGARYPSAYTIIRPKLLANVCATAGIVPP